MKPLHLLAGAGVLLGGYLLYEHEQSSPSSPTKPGAKPKPPGPFGVPKPGGAPKPTTGSKHGTISVSDLAQYAGWKVVDVAQVVAAGGLYPPNWPSGALSLTNAEDISPITPGYEGVGMSWATYQAAQGNKVFISPSPLYDDGTSQAFGVWVGAAPPDALEVVS